MHRRLSSDNIFIKIFVFHLPKFSILNFSLQSRDFLFFVFSQNSFLQMSRNQIINPTFYESLSRHQFSAIFLKAEKAVVHQVMPKIYGPYQKHTVLGENNMLDSKIYGP